MRPYIPADRAAALRSLIKLDRPLKEAATELASFPWDWAGDPLGTIARSDVASVLNRWLAGQVTSDEVEGWANALECRDDVTFDTGETREAIFELANPALHAADWLDHIAARYAR